MTDLERAKAIAQLAETLSLESDRRSSYGLLLDASVIVGKTEIGMVKLGADLSADQFIAEMAEHYTHLLATLQSRDKGRLKR